MKKLCLIVLLMGYAALGFSQTVTQIVKGTVKDQSTQEELVGASIEILNSDPLQGTYTEVDGSFTLEDVPVGRQSFRISMLGYESYDIRELMVTSGKEIVLDISLKESSVLLDELVITYKRKKTETINTMATLSSRKFTVEETQKYAGGMGDPARLVTSFAGVASPAVNNNGISVRGNSPAGLLWRIDGVEVSSPSHFADLIISGSGLLTVLSSQMLSNSDFFTGAFPAEYGNATSGVFDINLRKGNDTKREYTLQAGVLGLDFATEGPFKQGKKSSYLMNYRYSTLGLISHIFPTDEFITYQDLSFKLNLPSEKYGKFSIWGVGAYDRIKTKALDQKEWKDIGDRENGKTSVNMYAAAIDHTIAVLPKSFLNSTLSYSGNGLSHEVTLLDNALVEQPKSDANKTNNKWTLQSALTTYFSPKHTNRTGFYLNRLAYDFDVVDQDAGDTEPQKIIDENGAANLLQFYTQSKYEFSPKWSANVGLHAQYFHLNKKYSIEPRTALSYKINDRNNLSFAYGLHSKIEPLAIYFIKNNAGESVNRQLDIMKSHHFGLAYSSMLTDDINVTIEPYYQYLSDVPVAPDSYISTLNNKNNLFFNNALVSKGTGHNIGVDLTVERYLKNGLYYMVTASIFDSKYTPLDGIERNTRFNKNYVMNALIGKEWQIGRHKNSFLSADIRLNYLGGNRADVVDAEKSKLYQQVVFGETNGNRAFAKKHQDIPVVSFTVAYRRNKAKYSSVWTLQVLNASNTKEFQSYIYNQKTQQVESKLGQNMIPNLSYRIEF